MIKRLKKVTVQMMAGANVATIIIMFLVGYSDCPHPASISIFCNAGLAFPLFLVANLCFLFFWLIFKTKYALIPCLGFVVCYVPVRQYTPFNVGREAPEGSIKVLSYNTWYYGGQTEGPDEVNPVIQYLKDQDADIVCLQESSPTSREQEQIDSLLLPVYAYRDTTRYAVGKGDMLAFFSKYPILSKERITYDSQNNMTMAYRLRIDHRDVIVINNHLESTGLTPEERKQFKELIKGKLKTDTAEEASKLLVVKLAEATRKRASQAEAVAQYVERHKGSSVILCGDFNDGPISYAHRTIAKHLTDCYIASGNGPGISYHKGGFYVRIDNIMCSEDWRPYGCKVDNEISVSDHYPIICYLKSSRNRKK